MWSVIPILAFLSCALAADTACTSADSYDFSNYEDKTYTYVWKEDAGKKQYVVLSLCGHINVSCGVQGTCSRPNCCTFCQLWDADSGTDGACIGTKYDSFTPITGGLKMKYSDGDPVTGAKPGPREGFVDVICGDDDFKMSNFQEAMAILPDGKYAYNLTVTTKAACGGGGIGGGGFFLIIIFAVILPVYLIGGVLWNKFKEHKEGVEVIPNYEFWAASPGYFLAGCAFTKDKVLGLCGRSGYDTVS